MLEKTLESPLDWKEVQPVHSKGNQFWVLNQCWSWNFNPLATWCEELTHWKRPWCWERLKAGGEGDDRGQDGWVALPAPWTWVWETPWDGEEQGSLVCWSPCGCKEPNTPEQLNKTVTTLYWILLLSCVPQESREHALLVQLESAHSITQLSFFRK